MTYIRDYQNQRSNAKRRGIDFNLTFDEWTIWWQNTGKLHLRGRSKGCYVMGRKGDTGPYQLDNIICISFGENSTQGNTGNQRAKGYKHTPEALLKIAEASRNRVFSDETRKKLSNLKKGNTYNIGRVCSEDTRLKISLATRGKKKPRNGGKG